MPADLALLVGIARRHRLEIGAGTEIAAGPGKYRDRGLRIGIESQKRVEQFARGGAIDGITAMRAVDGDDGHRSIAFDKHGIGVGHVRRSLLLFFHWSAFRGDANGSALSRRPMTGSASNPESRDSRCAIARRGMTESDSQFRPGNATIGFEIALAGGVHHA